MAKRHPVLTVFGRNLRRQREIRNLTQEVLAEKADLDQTYISGIERGIRNPSVLVTPQAFRSM
jgi:transcriptional regulator with XRE-family HTH domain